MTVERETDPEPRWIVAIKIFIAILIPNVGGLVGAVFSTDSIATWYPTLEKPSWTPPNWLFVPMWVCLYTLMGLASYLVYIYGAGLKGRAKWIFLVYLTNLILNWSWSPVFFTNRNVFAGFILIIFILGTAILEAAFFATISWIAGALILPYVAWLVVAAALNGWIYIYNT